ncbi:MAG: hypothetical protein LBO66_01260 [Deltaproteobacteria bacterium]|jgi:hypothetical protein|nr:hypothetical protein [Deltaproteobacteria bacterium]
MGEYPIMMDDTCYFLNFEKLSDALIVLSLLNGDECVAFLKSIAFLDSKRPFTKEILQRIDLLALSKAVKLGGVNRFLSLNLAEYQISATDFDSFEESVTPLGRGVLF